MSETVPTNLKHVHNLFKNKTFFKNHKKGPKGGFLARCELTHIIDLEELKILLGDFRTSTAYSLPSRH